MKQFLFAFLGLLMFSFQANAQKAKKNEATVTIKTSSVCNMCKNTLEKAMAFEKGVKSSELNVKTQELTVVYNPKKTDLTKIKTAINAVGYDADDMPAKETAYSRLPDCCKKDQEIHE